MHRIKLGDKRIFTKFIEVLKFADTGSILTPCDLVNVACEYDMKIEIFVANRIKPQFSLCFARVQ